MLCTHATGACMHTRCAGFMSCRNHNTGQGASKRHMTEACTTAIDAHTCSLPELGTRATVSMMPRTTFAVFALGTVANRGRSSVSSVRSA